jgi:hypothetical protein
MHRVGKSIESFATTTGANIPFVKIPNWEFHWQDNFVFPNTVKVNSGSILKATAFYDNTTNNADNPNSPPLTVSAGENTGDEMMLVFFAYLPYQAGDENLIVDKRVTPTSSTEFCQGQSVKLKTIEGVGYTYQWNKDGLPIANATNSSYVATVSGNYTVSITLGSNNAVSDPIPVNVIPTPTANISSSTTIIPSGSSVTLTASSGNNYTYQWYLNGQPIANATNVTFDATVGGDYTVEVYNGCYSTSAAKTLTVALGTPSFNISQIVVYPNPNNGVFYIKNANHSSMSIINLMGQLIGKTEINSNDFQINLKDKGVYLLQITTEEQEIKIEKIIVR